MLNTFVQGIGIFTIALVGGFAGAVAKHIFAFLGKNAERKTISRDTIEALAIEMLDEIRTLSINYWSNDETPESKTLAARIVALNDHLPDLYIQLFDNKLDVSRKLDILLNQLSQAATGGNFQQKDRKADLSIVAEMEKHAMSLKVAIRIEKAKLPYPWK